MNFLEANYGDEIMGLGSLVPDLGSDQINFSGIADNLDLYPDLATILLDPEFDIFAKEYPDVAQLISAELKQRAYNPYSPGDARIELTGLNFNRFEPDVSVFDTSKGGDRDFDVRNPADEVDRDFDVRNPADEVPIERKDTVPGGGGKDTTPGGGGKDTTPGGGGKDTAQTPAGNDLWKYLAMLAAAKFAYDDAKEAREAAKGKPFSGAQYSAGRTPGGSTFFVKKAASGGLMDVAPARYFAGGTDGMADQLPAHIDNRRPAALSDGEFVIPADVVSHLGNGNSNAGAERLYEMMDRVREARTGTKEQGKQINPEKFTGGIASFSSGGTTSSSTTYPRADGTTITLPSNWDNLPNHSKAAWLNLNKITEADLILNKWTTSDIDYWKTQGYYPPSAPAGAGTGAGSTTAKSTLFPTWVEWVANNLKNGDEYVRGELTKFYPTQIDEYLAAGRQYAAANNIPTTKPTGTGAGSTTAKSTLFPSWVEWVANNLKEGEAYVRGELTKAYPAQVNEYLAAGQQYAAANNIATTKPTGTGTGTGTGSTTQSSTTYTRADGTTITLPSG